MKAKIILALLFFAAGFCAAEESFMKYVVKPGDILNIIVAPTDEISKEVIVQKDGNISLKLIGEIQAGGLTLQELQTRLEKEISRYVTRPVVSVTLKEFGKSKVYVLGEIRSPGSYDFKDGMKLLEVISNCGGFSPNGDATKVKIFRGKEQKTIIELNAEDLLNRGDFTKNVDINVDDIIYVQPKGDPPFAWFMNNIMPGLYIVSTVLTIVILVR